MSQSITYLVDESKYEFSYQDLKAQYKKFRSLSDPEFLQSLPDILHLSCMISFIKGLSAMETLSDKGIIHQLTHLLCKTDGPDVNLEVIRTKFNDSMQLA